MEQQKELLSIEEILEQYKIVKSEAIKWTTMANTLSKCYTLVQNLLEQQKQLEEEIKKRNEKEKVNNNNNANSNNLEQDMEIPQLMEPTIKSIG